MKISQADVGVAIGSAADISLEVANVVMLSDNLHLLVVALDISNTGPVRRGLPILQGNL